MKVVASQKGKYGTVRERGEEFTLLKADHFSKRWMVKANSKEAKAILAEAGPTGLTAAQIAAEEAAATGSSDKKLKALIKELEAKNAALQKQLDAVTDGTKDNDGGDEDAPGDEDTDEGGEDDENADAGSEAPDKPRKRRTRRSK